MEPGYSAWTTSSVPSTQGKIADLVLLKGDLVADPSVIRNVVTVYKDGVAYDPTKLINAIRGRVGVN